MDEMEKLYIKTLLWAYERHQEGFTLEELRQSIGLTDDQWIWWREMFITTNGNDRKLIDLYQRGDDGNEYRYTLNDKGMAVVLEYLELQESRVESQKANKRALTSTVFAAISLISVVVSIWFQIDSNNLSRKALELSSRVQLSLSVDTSLIPEQYREEVLEKIGQIQTPDNQTTFRLANKSISDITINHIDMTLWETYVSNSTKHINVCPLGYVHFAEDHSFKVQDIRTSQLYGVESHSLESGRVANYSLDFDGLKNYSPTTTKRQIVLKTNIQYTKEVDKTTGEYTKLFILKPYGNVILDLDLLPTTGFLLTDIGNDQYNWDASIPSNFVDPFKEDELIDYFYEIPVSDHIYGIQCMEFEMEKEQRIIYY